jgi:hypothetical protein
MTNLVSIANLMSYIIGQLCCGLNFVKDDKNSRKVASFYIIFLLNLEINAEVKKKKKKKNIALSCYYYKINLDKFCIYSKF